MSDCEEEFEDTKGVISSRKSKNKQQTTQWPTVKPVKLLLSDMYMKVCLDVLLVSL